MLPGGSEDKNHFGLFTCGVDRKWHGNFTCQLDLCPADGPSSLPGTGASFEPRGALASRRCEGRIELLLGVT